MLGAMGGFEIPDFFAWGRSSNERIASIGKLCERIVTGCGATFSPDALQEMGGCRCSIGRKDVKIYRLHSLSTQITLSCPALARHEDVRSHLSDDRVLAGGSSCTSEVGLTSSPLSVLACELLLGPLVAARDQLLDETALPGLVVLV